MTNPTGDALTFSDKAQALLNLPNEFRIRKEPRGRDSFEIGGEDRGEVPVARVTTPELLMDLAYSEEILDDGEYATFQHILAMRTAYLSIMTAKPGFLARAQPEEGRLPTGPTGLTLADKYSKLLANGVSKETRSIITIMCSPYDPKHEKVQKWGLFQVYLPIQAALRDLQDWRKVIEG